MGIASSSSAAAVCRPGDDSYITQYHNLVYNAAHAHMYYKNGISFTQVLH